MSGRGGRGGRGGGAGHAPAATGAAGAAGAAGVSNHDETSAPSATTTTHSSHHHRGGGGRGGEGRGGRGGGGGSHRGRGGGGGGHNNNSSSNDRSQQHSAAASATSQQQHNNGSSNHQHDAAADGEELASKVIMCELKRVWVDLKSNPRGKFLKISEQDATGARQKINVPLSGAARFRDILTSLAALDASLGADGGASGGGGGGQGEDPAIKSLSFRTENKMFYFDLRANARGRFLKISQVMQVVAQRTTIVIPARGIASLRDAVEEVCKDDPQASAGLEPVPTIPQDQLPTSQSVTAEQKRFFFDAGSNARGVFLRISEVVGGYRTAITVPRAAWPQFRQVIQQYEDGITTATEVAAGDAE